MKRYLFLFFLTQITSLFVFFLISIFISISDFSLFAIISSFIFLIPFLEINIFLPTYILSCFINFSEKKYSTLKILCISFFTGIICFYIYSSFFFVNKIQIFSELSLRDLIVGSILGLLIAFDVYLVRWILDLCIKCNLSLINKRIQAASAISRVGNGQGL